MTEKSSPRKPVLITWLGHASFSITGTQKIYVDPWKIEGEPGDGDLVLISHSHYDHCSQEDIHKVSAPGCTILAAQSVVQETGLGEALLPGGTWSCKTVSITGIPAYNMRAPYHSRKKQWLGFVIALDGRTIYYAGDTDLIPEMQELPPLDAALLPIGGTYTMDAAQAAEAAAAIQPKLVIPYHWGDIIGSLTDAKAFLAAAPMPARLLVPGEPCSIS